MTALSPSNLGPKLATFIAVMVAVAIPLRVIGVAPQQLPLSLALIGALVLYYISTEIRQRIKQTLTSKTTMFVGAIVLAWAITIPFSLSPLGSAKIGGRSFLFLFAIVLVWAALKSHKDVHELLWKVLVIGTIACTAAAVLSLLDVPLILAFMKADLSTHEFPQQAFKSFAASELCLIPIVIWAGRRLGGNWRFCAYTHAPLAISVIMLTHNRAALAGLLAMIGIVIFSIVRAKHRHTNILLVLAAGAAIAIIAWVRIDRLPLVAAHIHGTYLPVWLVDPHRQSIWKFAFEKFLNHPWLGNGIDQLSKLSGANVIVPELGHSAFFLPSHPHNWALEILAESGIIGFLPVFAALAYIAWQLMKRFVRTQDEDALAQIALMAGFWASALFNFSIWAVWWQLTFFTLFAIVAAAPPRKI
ncbi:O-antigen ligase family protein [Magnetovibrio blakemorei]|nr:O-antigen ligase family protein [Magnetovibrio blakemorei]